VEWFKVKLLLLSQIPIKYFFPTPLSLLPASSF